MDVKVEAIVGNVSMELDCYSIDFAYEQPRAPIYGYTSNVSRTRMQGTAMVHGSLQLNLTDPATLGTLFNSTFKHTLNTPTFYDIEMASSVNEAGTERTVPFSDAFAEARARLGRGKHFLFNGEVYSTNTAQDLVNTSNISWKQNRSSAQFDLLLTFYKESADATAEPSLPKGAFIGKYPNYGATFYTNTARIKGVEFTTRSHTITPAPDNIIENYQFIARSLA